jgi:DNA modification methylase
VEAGNGQAPSEESAQAAEQTGRRCVATELDPKYCAVILERMSAYGLQIEKIDGIGE